MLFDIIFRSLHVAIVTSRVSRDNTPADGNRAHRRRDRHFYIRTRTDRVWAYARLWDTCFSLCKKKIMIARGWRIDVAKDGILPCDDRMTVDYDIVLINITDLILQMKRKRGKKKIQKKQVHISSIDFNSSVRNTETVILIYSIVLVFMGSFTSSKVPARRCRSIDRRIFFFSKRGERKSLRKIRSRRGNRRSWRADLFRSCRFSGAI